MIIWRGFGFLTVILFFAFSYLSMEASKSEVILSYIPKDYIFVIAFLLLAVLNAVIGRYLNTRPGKVLIDPDTNSQVEIKDKHSLFWVPMEYYSLLFVAAIVLNLAARN